MTGTQQRGAGLADVRAEARSWLEAHAADGPDAAGPHEPMGYHLDERAQLWISQLRSGRWLCLSWPEEYGGRALNSLEVIAVNEEFARAGVTRPRLGMGENLVAPAILAFGTAEQKARFLPRILAGEDVY